MRQLIATLVVIAVVAAANAADDKSPGVVVDKDKRTVTIDAKVAPRKIDHPSYKGEIYPIEVVACWPFLGEPGKGGEKAHETVVTIDVKIKPSTIHKALEELGLKPGQPIAVEGKEPKGPKINVYIEVTGPDGEPKRLTMDKVLLDPKTKKPFPKSVEFRFTGSNLIQLDPEKPDKTYGADQSGTLIAIYPVTEKTVCQTSLTLKEEKVLKLETNKEALPKEGTPVKLVLEVPAK
ncbi:MAG TPA: YdjY domain-containing protein [Gemmataceae bacterium]|nr:YdjY domain-containing protein [Gemmataceae bacterium]